MFRQQRRILVPGGGDLGEAVPGLDDAGLHLPGRGERAHHMHLKK